MHRLRAGTHFFLLAALLSTPSLALAQVGASLPCPGAHFATQMEADAASPKGSIIAGVTYVCPTDAPLGINNDSGAAKDYLKTVLCPPDGDNYGGYGPDETIRRLDPKFASCAATFLKSLNTSGPPYCIREGARTVEKQNAYVARGVIACQKGAMCEHPRGIALDINIVAGNKNDCTNYTRAHQLAPQFGLTFYMGCKDAYHVVPQKGGCTDANFTAPSSSGLGSVPTGGTNASGILPSSYYDYPQYASAASPYSTALNAVTPLLMSSLLNNPTQPVATPVTPAYTAPVTPDPITLPTATSSIFTAPPPYEYPFLGTTTRPTSSTGPSAYEQIQMLTGSHTGSSQSGQSGTSSPTQLNPDLYDIVKGSSNSNIPEDIGVQDTLAVNSVAVNPIHVTETFTRDEPTIVAPPNGTSSVTSSGNQTLIVALLTTLRNLLVSFVNILKSHSSGGFQAPWQAPSATPAYR